MSLRINLKGLTLEYKEKKKCHPPKLPNQAVRCDLAIAYVKKTSRF